MPQFQPTLATQEPLVSEQVQLPKTYISRQKTLKLERIHWENEERMAKTLQTKLNMKRQRQATVQRAAYKEVLLTLKEIQDLKKPLGDNTARFKPSFRVSLRLQKYSNEWRKNHEF